jgi:hypothetical protein
VEIEKSLRSARERTNIIEEQKLQLAGQRSMPVRDERCHDARGKTGIVIIVAPKRPNWR